MSIAVRYYSRGGNTKKLAEAIAKAVGVEAESVDRPLDEKTDIVFLGSSVYAGGVDESVKRFLRKNQSQIGTLYNFSTSAMAPSTYRQVKKLADELEITLSEWEYYCPGSFLFLNLGCPSKGDLLRASSFAKLAERRAEKAGAGMADALDTLEKAASKAADALSGAADAVSQTAAVVLDKTADAAETVAENSEKAE